MEFEIVALPKQVLVNISAICFQSRVPVFWIGRPGSSKSVMLRVITGLLDKDYLWRRVPVPGKYTLADIVGIPRSVRHEETQREYVRETYWKYILDLEVAERGVLMFDELAEVPLQQQSNYLTLLCEKIFGDVDLSHISMCAAGNPADGQLHLKPPLMNRICLAPWDISTKESGVDFNAMFPDPPVPTVAPEWEKTYLRVRMSEIGGYIGQLEGFRLVSGDSDSDPQEISEDGPHPSRRSWEQAAKVLAALDATTIDGKPFDADHCGDTYTLTMKVNSEDFTPTAFAKNSPKNNAIHPLKTRGKPSAFQRPGVWIKFRTAQDFC